MNSSHIFRPVLAPALFYTLCLVIESINAAGTAAMSAVGAGFNRQFFYSHSAPEPPAHQCGESVQGPFCQRSALA